MRAADRQVDTPAVTACQAEQRGRRVRCDQGLVDRDLDDALDRHAGARRDVKRWSRSCARGDPLRFIRCELRAIEPRIVDRRGHARCQLLGSQEIVPIVVAATLRPDESQGAEDRLARDKRDDQHGAESDLPDQFKLFGGFGRRLQHLVGDHLVELRSAGAQDVREPDRGVEIGGSCLRSSPCHSTFAGSTCETATCSDDAVIDQSHATNGEPRHHQPSDLGNGSS